MVVFAYHFVYFMSRINHQPAFLLTSKPWRENSLRLEAFSRDYGRVSLLARSARTRGSELRGVLIPFVPLSASWYGKEELKTLHRAEWLGGWMQPHSRALFSALYANELVLKLTAREDPHPDIYHALHDLMRVICTQSQHLAALRQFEFRLLNALGVAPDFTRDVEGQEIDGNLFYWIQPEQSVQQVSADFRLPEKSGEVVRGTVLQQIVSGEFLDAESAQAASKAMRVLIDFRQPDIQTRNVLQQLNQLKQKIK